MIDQFCGLLFLMLAGHALCDAPLQPGRLSAAKRVGGDPSFPWWAALGFHGLIHGGAVALVTGHWWLGVFETVTHAWIDSMKCRGFFGTIADQALHVGFKIIWALIAVGV